MYRTRIMMRATVLKLDVAAVIEFWSERAAIREHEGGLPRELAEEYAYDDTMMRFDPEYEPF